MHASHSGRKCIGAAFYCVGLACPIKEKGQMSRNETESRLWKVNTKCFPRVWSSCSIKQPEKGASLACPIDQGYYIGETPSALTLKRSPIKV